MVKRATGTNEERGVAIKSELDDEEDEEDEELEEEEDKEDDDPEPKPQSIVKLLPTAPAQVVGPAPVKV